MSFKLLGAAIAVLLPLLSVGTASASFNVYYYQGDRTEVRAYCLDNDGVLLDRPDYTFCEDETLGSSRTCLNNGDCIGTGLSVDTTGSVSRYPIPGVDVAPTSTILPN
jgi:hypothetical protein